MSSSPLDRRTSGVLLHPTSLPGPHGNGDLGPAAFAFADWLAAAGQTWWQMLPVGPPGFGGSPYDSPSAFAGSPWLVSLERLAQAGLLETDEIAAPPELGRGRVDHDASAAYREPRLRAAFERYRGPRGEALRRERERFRNEHAAWLDDYCLYAALRDANAGACWVDWAPAQRDREASALQTARRELAASVEYHEFVQLCFDLQWRALRDHCRQRGLMLLGDVPMFVAYDGADVWSHRELFFLDDAGRRQVVAGVPPDAFSETGQLWGNPLYRWDHLERTDFAWWLDRLRCGLARFDALRLDHFIGFRRYWEVPVDAPDARSGRFVHVPGEAFFERCRRALGGLPFLAEDLGIVTEEVTALRRRFDLPGMKVLAFAFGDDGGNDYQPHRYERRTTAYTGTHDNDTLRGWLDALRARGDHGHRELERIHRYVGGAADDLHWGLIHLASQSVANVAMFPLQDVLVLGSEARMNLPGTSTGNWGYRLGPGQLREELAHRLRSLAVAHERSGSEPRGDAARFQREFG